MKNRFEIISDKIYGSIIGGAAGDALGYPVEFLSASYIKEKFGKDGITEYEKSGGKALISDDLTKAHCPSGNPSCDKTWENKYVYRKRENGHV